MGINPAEVFFLTGNFFAGHFCNLMQFAIEEVMSKKQHFDCNRKIRDEDTKIKNERTYYND